MKQFPFCEGNVLLTRNGGIEGSLFGVRNVSMETSVKVIFYLPGMVASRDFLGSTLLGIKTLCNQLEFWMLTTTVTNMINGKKNKEATDAWVVFLTWLSFPNISVSSSCFCETTKIWTSCSNLIVTAWLFWHSFCMLLTRLWGTFFLTGWECCCVGLHQGKNTDPTWCNEKYSWEVSSPTQSYTSWYLIIKGLLWQLYRLKALYIYIVSLVVP